MKAVVTGTLPQDGFSLFIVTVDAPEDPTSQEATDYIRWTTHIIEALLNMGPQFLINAIRYVPEEMQDEAHAYLVSWPGALPWLDKLWDEWRETKDEWDTRT